MRMAVTLGIVLAVTASVLAQAGKEDKLKARYGIEPDPRTYPQETPKETLASVLQAIEKQRINYLLAHLTDPQFVDQRVKQLGGNFDLFVRETTTKLRDNPESVKELSRFLKEGDWEGGDTTATASLKDVKDRKVFLRKIGNRWFLENRQKGSAPPP